MFYIEIGVNLTLILVLFKNLMNMLDGILNFIANARYTCIVANEVVNPVTPLVTCCFNLAAPSLASAEMTQQ